MATTTNKQKILAQLLGAAGKNAKDGVVEPRPVLEQFIYGICREASTRSLADRAFQALQQRFFDWNEVRVSSVEELVEAMEGLGGDLEARAQRILDFLQEVFETTFSFDLESLHKKGVKQAAKQLSRYKAATDFAISWVVQHSLDGHAIPLDAPSLRTLKRLQLVEENANLDATRASLEHQIPKAKGATFVDALSEIAEGQCWETDPACPACAMKTCCPTAKESRPSPPSKKPR